MKKVMFIAVLMVVTIFCAVGFDYNDCDATESIDKNSIPGYFVVCEEVDDYDSVKEAEEAYISKAIEGHHHNDTSAERAALRKTEFFKNGKIDITRELHIDADYNAHFENAKPITSYQDCSSSFIQSVRIHKQDDNTYKMGLRKSWEDEEKWIDLGEYDTFMQTFHSFKSRDNNYYYRNGSMLYVLDEEKLELNLIADDFLDSVVCAEDDHYYYINTDNNFVDENKNVIFENVFGVSNNEYGSNYLTIYR